MRHGALEIADDEIMAVYAVRDTDKLGMACADAGMQTGQRIHADGNGRAGSRPREQVADSATATVSGYTTSCKSAGATTSAGLVTAGLRWHGTTAWNCTPSLQKSMSALEPL